MFASKFEEGASGRNSSVFIPGQKNYSVYKGTGVAKKKTTKTKFNNITALRGNSGGHDPKFDKQNPSLMQSQMTNFSNISTSRLSQRHD